MALPTSKTTFTPKANGGVIEASHINDIQNSVTGIEDTVGITGSTDVNSVKYKLENTSSVNPGHKHSTASISDFNISSPTNGQALSYNSTSGKWENATTAVADASTTVKGITKLSVAPVTANNPIAVGDNDGRLPTQAENDAMVGTSGTAVSGTNKLVDNADTGTSGANKVLRLDGTGKLPALNGSLLTGVTTKRYADVTQTTISPSATVTCVNTTLSANSLSVGSVLRFKAFFSFTHFLNNTGPQFTFSFGGTALHTYQITPPNPTNTYPHTFEIELYVITNTTINMVIKNLTNANQSSGTAIQFTIPTITSNQSITLSATAGPGSGTTYNGSYYEIL